MKLITSETPEEKGFTPFNITLRVETAEEARLLWHIFNRNHLRHAIGLDYKRIDKEKTADDFNGGSDIRNYIASKLTNVGGV